jgi:hypothetical protein
VEDFYGLDSLAYVDWQKQKSYSKLYEKKKNF